MRDRLEPHRLARADFVDVVVERVWAVDVQVPFDAGSRGAEHVHGGQGLAYQHGVTRMPASAYSPILPATTP